MNNFIHTLREKYRGGTNDIVDSHITDNAKKDISSTFLDNLPENPSKEEVIAYMMSNTLVKNHDKRVEDRDERVAVVYKIFGIGKREEYKLPKYWFREILESKINPHNVYDNIPFEFNIDDLDDCYVKYPPEEMPFLSDGDKLICECCDHYGNRIFFRCKNLKDFKNLYSEYYWGKFKHLYAYILKMTKRYGLTKEASDEIEDFKIFDGFNGKRPEEMPSLPIGYKLFCSYNEGWSSKSSDFLKVCNTLEGAQKMYDEYSKGNRKIERFIGKFKEGVKYRSRIHE